MADEEPDAAVALANRIRPLLKGLPPAVIGAALADLVATLIAGHLVRDDEKRTSEVRERILHMHIAAVRALIPINHHLLTGQDLPDEVVEDWLKQEKLKTPRPN